MVFGSGKGKIKGSGDGIVCMGEREDAVQEGEEGEGVKGREGLEDWAEEDGRRQGEERREKIVQSRYNKLYREIVTRETPKYLAAGWGEARYGRIARFSLGNKLRGEGIGRRRRVDAGCVEGKKRSGSTCWNDAQGKKETKRGSGKR